MSTAELSEAQRKIYELHQNGLTFTQIANKLNMSPGILSAQVTRMTKKIHGFNLAARGRPVAQDESKQAASVGHSDLNDICQKAAQHPFTATEYIIPSDKVEAHPLVIMGVTIQFVKLCGGRMAAHEAIESVYQALQKMVS